ncbi:MAG: hypothetical protein J2P44_10010 [Candidatus Dormibacteraeota bacterium]|nr:hypothetical protein [Candidatus Dormibacteraeota bacterium]
MALLGSGSSDGITIGDRPIGALDERMARSPGDRSLSREQRDWLLVRSVLQPGERPWSRVAVRFPEQNNVPGHLFLTDRRLLFEYREMVLSIDLGYIDYLGPPTSPSRADFAVQAIAPDSYGGSRFGMLIKVKDTETFHDFFPTLLALARALGAQPHVDPRWDGAGAPAPAAAPAPVADVATGRRAPAERHPEAVEERALGRLLRPDETVVITAEMIHHVGGAPVTLLVTNERLVVVDASVVWATGLGHVRVIDGGVAMTQLRLLVTSVDDAIAVATGNPPARTIGTQRLVLHARDNAYDTEQVRRYLAQHGGGVLPAWPADGDRR